MIQTILQVLSAGLSIWEHKESRKYQDKLIKLEKEIYEEYNKEIPDNAVLDNLYFELQLLGKAFYSEIGTKNSLDKQG